MAVGPSVSVGVLKVGGHHFELARVEGRRRSVFSGLGFQGVGSVAHVDFLVLLGGRGDEPRSSNAQWCWCGENSASEERTRAERGQQDVCGELEMFMWFSSLSPAVRQGRGRRPTVVFGSLMWGEASKLFMVKTVAVNHHRPCRGALPGPDRDPATLCAHPYRR